MIDVVCYSVVQLTIRGSHMMRVCVCGFFFFLPFIAVLHPVWFHLYYNGNCYTVGGGEHAHRYQTIHSKHG